VSCRVMPSRCVVWNLVSCPPVLCFYIMSCGAARVMAWRGAQLMWRAAYVARSLCGAQLMWRAAYVARSLCGAQLMWRAAYVALYIMLCGAARVMSWRVVQS
jgi:hypothetical protein